MSGTLNHTPAQIIQKLMINHLLGDDPASSTSSWPIYHNKEVNLPDQIITVSTTTGVNHGRHHPDGKIAQHYGISIRVRSISEQSGYVKSSEIDTELLESVNREGVVLGASTYCVENITRSGQINSLGNPPDSQRFIFTINYLVSVRLTS